MTSDHSVKRGDSVWEGGGTVSDISRMDQRTCRLTRMLRCLSIAFWDMVVSRRCIFRLGPIRLLGSGGRPGLSRDQTATAPAVRPVHTPPPVWGRSGDLHSSRTFPEAPPFEQRLCDGLHRVRTAAQLLTAGSPSPNGINMTDPGKRPGTSVAHGIAYYKTSQPACLDTTHNMMLML